MNRRQFVRGATMLGVAAGFARPAGAAGPPAMSEGKNLAERGAQQPPGRSSLIVNGLDPSHLTEEYLAMLKKAGVTCWHTTAFGVLSFADIYTFVDRHRDKIEVATTVSAIKAARDRGTIALVLGWQMADPIESSARSTENDWWGDPPRTHLRAYYQLGLRIFNFVYQVSNIFGGGCLENDVPLTRAGRRLVEQIHGLRIVLDVGGHTGERTSLDALAMSSGVPVVCTHTNVAALNDNPRATSNKVLEAIAKTGGVIGLTAINDFVNRNRRMAALAETPWGGIDTLLDQYDYLRKLIGVDHLGLGPDFTYGSSAQRDTRLFPPEAIDKGPRRFVKGFENITELPNLIRGFRDRGWSSEEIDKVLGGNWLRVYQRVWGA